VGEIYLPLIIKGAAPPMPDLVGAFTFVPDAIVCFRPRTSLRAFFKQYYLYAR
jgi:hypothetical protein